MDQRYNLTRIKGVEVLDRRGVALGTIEEITLNVEEGYIECATLRIESRGKGRELEVIIPWSQFRLAENCKALELDISLAVLETVARRRPFTQ